MPEFTRLKEVFYVKKMGFQNLVIYTEKVIFYVQDGYDSFSNRLIKNAFSYFCQSYNFRQLKTVWFNRLHFK